MKARVTNIQRFSLHDGPGIRTTVFLKGCSLHCPWCSNPENIKFDLETYEEDGKIKTFGYDITLEELEKEILKDETYYLMNQGGVTFSGGEVLLQINQMAELLQKLKEKNIHICIETCLFAPLKNLKIALPYVDLFIVDLKTMDEETCKNILHGDLSIYLRNIDFLFQHTDRIKIRIPVSKEYVLEEIYQKKILEFLKIYHPKEVEIFKLHYLAKKKYHALNQKMITFKEVTVEELEKFASQIESLNIQVKICEI